VLLSGRKAQAARNDRHILDAARAQELNVRLFDRTKAAGAIRSDIEMGDISMLLEQLAAIRVADEERTRQLRHRYLALILEALPLVTLSVTVRRRPPGRVGL
jgi:hypothetical protein